MTRILLQYVLPLLLPTLVWLIWYATIGRKRTVEADQARRWQDGPWFWLIILGIGLLAASLVYAGLTQGFAPSGTYVPPRWEGGRVVPGHVD